MNKKNQTKKKIRVEGIPMGRSIVTFGKNIEAKMNSMLKDGYRVNLFEREEGMLVLGDAVPEPEYEPAHSLMRLVQLQVPGQQPKQEPQHWKQQPQVQKQQEREPRQEREREPVQELPLSCHKQPKRPQQ